MTAEFLAGKIYRFLVRDELSQELRKKLGSILSDSRYEVKPLLTAIFSSRDFWPGQLRRTSRTGRAHGR